MRMQFLHSHEHGTRARRIFVALVMFLGRIFKSKPICSILSVLKVFKATSVKQEKKPVIFSAQKDFPTLKDEGIVNVLFNVHN